VLVLALYLYTWLAIAPHLIFHGAGTISNFPVFRTGISPLLDSISRPGGAVEYASAFLAQLFIRSWAGAAVIVGLGWVLLRVTDASVRLVRAPSLRFLRFAGSAALALTFAQYLFEIQSYLAFAASTGLAVVVCRRQFRPTILWLLAGSFVVYHLAGGGYVVYAVVCALYEGHVRGRWWGAVAVLSTVALTPFALGMLVFAYGPWEAYTLLLPFSPGGLIHLIIPTRTVMSESLPATNAVVQILVATGFYLVSVSSFLVNGLSRLVRSGPVPARRGLCRVLVLAATVAALAPVYDHDRRDGIEADHLAYHGRWSELVERAHGYSPTPLVLHSVNRALFHTGELADRMFAFRQTGAHVLFLGGDGQIPPNDSNFPAPLAWRRAQLHMDLGLLRLARLEFVTLTEYLGARPMILRGIALVALALGDVGTARVSLGELSKSLFDSGWAAEKLARLDSDGHLEADPEIRRLRGRMCSTEGTSSELYLQPARLIPFFKPKHGDEMALTMMGVEETFEGSVDGEELLERLLADDPGNRMAFEYLMALRLLGRQLDAFVEGLAHRREPSARPLAVHYQEAIALHRENDGAGAPADRFVVDPTVVDRLTAYRSQQENRTEGENGEDGVMDDFEATYWAYYDAARPSGVAR